jgi:Nif-specific regulatory protein
MDDEAQERKRIEAFLKKKGYDAASVPSVAQAVELMQKDRFDVFLTDCNIPGVDALQTSGEARRINPDMAVIIMTAYGTIETAVKAIKAGAYDYVAKPIDLDQLVVLVERVAERRNLIRENNELREQLIERYKFDEIASTSHAMEEVLNLAGRVAGSNATVLLRGESGTGKELIAKAVHYHSPRANQPFIKVNCAALPETLLESELFGHEKGAFTGAAAKRIGRFEAADKGTIFLDEIGDIAPGVQVKLLRVLQEKEFERLGGNQTIKSDVRVIAATNRDLEKAMKEGTFREDLYYRLNVYSIYLPPLRERKTDIPLLCDHFVEKHAAGHAKDVRRIATSAIDMLMSYHWPGNVRELENCIERAVLVCEGGAIHAHHLPPTLQTAEVSGTLARQSLKEALAAYEKDLVQDALKSARGNRAKAARLLDTTERILGYAVRKHHLDPDRFR